MAKSSSTFNLNFTPTQVFFAFVLGLMILKGCHCNHDSDDESTETKPKVTTKTAEPDDDISITKKMVSGSEKDVLVVRAHDQQYVRIDDMVFCWRGSNLLGVFNKDGVVPGWQTFTNQPPTK